MYRSFLSWRYLFARRTNLIGMVGIFVAVGALILILSIMTGFLEESRKTVRGSLSDVLIEPWASVDLPADPDRLLEVVRGTRGVRGASAQLQWGGIITQSGREADKFQQIMSSPTHSQLLVVHLIGVDVSTTERFARVALAPLLAQLGTPFHVPRVQDEFDSTDFLGALTRTGPGGNGEPEGAPFASTDSRVRMPLHPFAPPRQEAGAGRPKAACVVGEQLYRTLDLYRGDEIQIATVVYDEARKDWVVNNREFVVAGTARTGENEADLARIYLARNELADFLGDTRRYTQVLVRLADYDKDGVRVRDELREELAAADLIFGSPMEVRTWEEFRGNLLGAIENERVLMAIMLSLVLVVAGFTIFAILSMMVTEKRRDVGILCALGATPRGILETFLMIAFWDALIGAFLGAVVGTWLAVEIDSIERWLSARFDVQIFNRDVYLFDHIPSIVEAGSVAVIVLGAFTCALLFAAVPAWRAARLDPLDALRYE